MEYVYAALLLNAAETQITEQTLRKTLESAGADVQSARIKALLTMLEEVDIQEAVERDTRLKEYVFAALLLDEVDTQITEQTLRRTLESAEVDVQSTRVETILNALEDVDIQEAVEDFEIHEATEDITGKKYPPDSIPDSPDVSINYDEFNEECVIGGGANADIRRVTIPKSNREVTVAIKEPRVSGTLHTDEIERMLQEAETWNKLDDHDHIVGVVDYGSKPLPWIAMEYMDGGHLGERSGEMEIRQAVWTALAVTKGVRHAHRRGVAHLDLKPENILFRTVDGAWDVPKVADWGLSKHLLEHSKSIEGYTPTYSAPEQLDDDYGNADHSTDVYQLGAVFYELFTGRPPFDGDRTGKIIRRVLTEKPTPPSEIADVPDALDDILLKALAKEKDERHDDIVYLRDDLNDINVKRTQSGGEVNSTKNNVETLSSNTGEILRCPECNWERPIPESTLRKGDFCPECHEGRLEGDT